MNISWLVHFNDILTLRGLFNVKSSLYMNINLYENSLLVTLFLNELELFISLSSSSCCVISPDIPDPLSPPLPIVHCRSSGLHPWSSCLCSSMWRGPREYIAYEFVPTSPAVSRMSGSSNFDSFRDGWSVAVHLLLCWELPPGFVQYCSQHSCVVAVQLFLHKFS